jgi:hypothetical protein
MATRWRISPVRDGGAGWLRWTGNADHASGSFSKVVGCSWTCRGRKGKKLVRSGDGESVMEIGEGAVTSLPTDRRQDGVDNMQGGGHLLYACARREGDGMARAR